MGRDWQLYVIVFITCIAIVFKYFGLWNMSIAIAFGLPILLIAGGVYLFREQRHVTDRHKSRFNYVLSVALIIIGVGMLVKRITGFSVERFWWPGFTVLIGLYYAIHRTRLSLMMAIGCFSFSAILFIDEFTDLPIGHAIGPYLFYIYTIIWLYWPYVFGLIGLAWLIAYWRNNSTD